MKKSHIPVAPFCLALMLTVGLPGLGLAAAPQVSDTINPLAGPACDAPIPLALNNTTKRVYTAGSGNTFGSNGRVSVIDAQTNTVIAGLSLPWGVDDIAVNETTNKIYLGTSSGPDGAHLAPQIAVVNGATNAVSTSPGNLGTQVLVDPTTGRLFATSYVSDTVRVYDGTSLALLADISLSNGSDVIRALKMALNPTARKLYVTNSSSNNLNVIGVIDLDQLVTRPFLHTTASNQAGLGNIVIDSALNKLVVGAYLPDGTGLKPAFLVIDCSSDSIAATINLTPNDFGVAGSTIFVGATADSTRHRAYFSDEYITPRTVVVDTQSNSVLGSFGTPFTNGSVLVSTGRIYATQYTTFSVPYWAKQNLIGAINPTDGSAIKITTGYRPWNARLNSTTGRVYVSDEVGNEILVFNASDHSLVARVPVGTTDTGIRDLAVSSVLNRYYLPRINQINPDGTNDVHLDVFNGATNQLATSVLLTNGFVSAPGFVAMDETRHRVYVTGQIQSGGGGFQSTLFVVNADTNAVIATPVITPSVTGLGVNPTNGHIYVATNNTGGSLQVLEPTNFTVVASPVTGRVPGPMAFDTPHHKLYVANQGAGSVDNTLTVIDTTNDTFATTISNVSENNGSDAVSCVAVDSATNTVFAGDNSNGFSDHGFVSAFDGANNYTYLGHADVGRYPTRMIFDDTTHELFVTNNETGTISVLGNGVPPPPPVPAHGGLSTTAFRVNGSKNPSSVVADSALHFSAQQSGTPNDLVVHVQFNTTSNNNATDWVDLNNGSAGYMTLDKTTQQFVLSSFNYPTANGIYFRALSKAGGFPDSKSNVVGPFNLTANKPHLSTTTLYLATTGPGAPIKFRSPVGTDQAGITLYIQSTLTPDDDASWIGLTDGRAGQMHPYADPKRFYLDSTDYPAGSVVYFRAWAKAVGFADSVSNIIGVKDVVVGTPAVLEITPLTTPVSGNDGSVPASPLVYNFGAIKFNARLDPTVPFTRQIKKISIFYDGAMIESLDGGATSVTADYTTTVPGDHVIKAVVVDELGIRGFAPPVYVRIKPPGGKIFTMTNSGNWTTASNWVDEQGQPGVPGAQDLAIVNGKIASIGSDVTSYAISLISGELNGTAGSLSVPGFFSIAAGALKNINLFINQSATMSLVGDLDIPISGTVTNNGTIRINGLGGIAPVPTGARSAGVATPDGFFDGIAAFFKNAGDFIFHRVNAKPKVVTPPAQPPVAPQPRLVAAEKFTNNGGRLLSENGIGLIAPNGAALIAPNGASLIGNDGAGLITNDGGSVISNDGASLIGNDGAGLITNDGGSRPAALSPDGESLADTAAAPGFTQTRGETDLNGMQIVSSVTLKGGTLSGSGVIAGSLTNDSGYISPGDSTGRIIVTGNFKQTANGTLIIEDGGLGFNKSDHLDVGGIATLGGNLHVRTIDGYHAAASDQFNPLTYDSVVGNFASAGGNATLTLNPTGAVAAINPAAAQPTVGQPQNISTRLRVLTNDNVLIGGFIVSGAPGTTKAVLIRGKGPSLSGAGLSGVLADPLLELHKPGATVTNDNWSDAPNKARIPDGFAPTSPLESIIIADLAPGNYTVIEKGAHGETGIGLTEIYDIDGSKTVALANISTRGFVDTGDNVMIGGFIVGGTEPASILVRATGPSLAQPPANLSGVLLDPVLELHDSNGSVIANDDWRATQEADIIATTVQPADDKEPAILATLVPGNYTAIVRGKDNTTGIAVVEAYKVK